MNNPYIGDIWFFVEVNIERVRKLGRWSHWDEKPFAVSFPNFKVNWQKLKYLIPLIFIIYCRGKYQDPILSYSITRASALYQERAVFGKMKMDPAKRAQTQNAGEV
jgi:hypothetical protein